MLFGGVSLSALLHVQWTIKLIGYWYKSVVQNIGPVHIQQAVESEFLQTLIHQKPHLKTVF